MYQNVRARGRGGWALTSEPCVGWVGTQTGAELRKGVNKVGISHVIFVHKGGED